MPDTEKKELWPGWETVCVIGRGAYGEVYEIRRNVFGREERAALKMITIPHYPSDVDECRDNGYSEEIIKAIFRSQMEIIIDEYSLMRELNGCTNVVSCDDFRVEAHEDGIGWDVFIRMELLKPCMKELPMVIPEAQVIRAGRDLCNALVRCESQDIIHRDIKPQNIFLSRHGDFKLGDFGIAKTIEKTSCGTKIGTPRYMAPEVYNNLPYGATADIYSLGLVLHWMLNERRDPFLPEGQPPTFSAEEEARTRRFRGDPVPEPKHGGPELKKIVAKAVAFHPADRYQTAAEMLEDLETLSRELSDNRAGNSRIRISKGNRGKERNIEEKTSGPEPEPLPSKQPPATVEDWVEATEAKGDLDFPVDKPETEEPPKKKSRAGLIAAVILVLLILGGAGGYIAWQGGSGHGRDVEEPTETQSIEPPTETADTQPPVVTTEPTTEPPAPDPMAEFRTVGAIVTFGHYEQDNDTTNGAEEIEWQVLDVQDGRALLISKNTLDVMRYHKEKEHITWERSSIRADLNSDFLWNAFTREEQSKILTTRIENKGNTHTNGGNDTDDRIFLLSLAEEKAYFSLTNLYGKPTDYAAAREIAYRQRNKNAVSLYWWLRTPSEWYQDYACYIAKQDEGDGAAAVNVYQGVRPAFWIDLGTGAATGKPSAAEPKAGTVLPSGGTSAPIVTEHPAGKTVKEGGYTGFTAKAENADTVVWHLVSTDKTDYTAESLREQFPGLQVIVDDSGRLTLNKVPAGLNGWTVCAEFINGGGSSWSNDALLTVTSEGLQVPTILTNPTGGTMKPGETIVLRIEAEASGTGTLIYQWYRSTTDSNTSGKAILGAVGTTYQPEYIEGTVYYYCTARATTGEQISSPAKSECAAVTCGK